MDLLKKAKRLFSADARNEQKVNELKVEQELSVVALVGEKMSGQVNVAGKMFNALGSNGINMRAIAQGRADEAPVDVPAQGVLPADSLGTPKDVASMILYLASDESRFVTGAEFLIDNGLLARPAM